MSKQKNKIEKFTDNINQLFELLNKIDLSEIDNLKELEKKAKALQKEIEKNSKNLDSKE